MENKDRMFTGELYLPNDTAITEEQTACLELLYTFNQTRPSEQEKRNQLLKQMFAEIGENCYIEPPFHANFGGKHVHFGKNIYANFNLTMVDDGHIYVGDYTMFAPGVIVATAGHPILPELRETVYQYNMPVHIGKNCWIGAGAIILPGVTIGDQVVVGAGSVVTKDLPSNVVAVGNPCRVIREISEHDRVYYFKNRKIDWDTLPRELNTTRQHLESLFPVCCLFSLISTIFAYSATPFCFNSARAVSTESTPVAFFTGANSFSRSTSYSRQFSCICTISSTKVSSL